MADAVGVAITAAPPVITSFRQEVQRISCYRGTGYFQFKFRGETTEKLYVGPNDEVAGGWTTASTLKIALERLSNIGIVSIAVIDGINGGDNKICPNSGSDPVFTDITFETELGDVPLLVIVGGGAYNGASFTASWSRPADTETVTRLTVSAVSTGTLAVGQTLVYSTGGTISFATTVAATESGSGGVGTYIMSRGQPAVGNAVDVVGCNPCTAVLTGSIAGTVLTVGTLHKSHIVLGQYLYGKGVAVGTKVLTKDISGTYTVSISQTVLSTLIVGSGVVTISKIAAIGAKRAQYECGGKGRCNRETGECACWPNYSSSDGFGSNGTKGDCGHSSVR